MTFDLGSFLFGVAVSSLLTLAVYAVRAMLSEH